MAMGYDEQESFELVRLGWGSPAGSTSGDQLERSASGFTGGITLEQFQVTLIHNSSFLIQNFSLLTQKIVTFTHDSFALPPPQIRGADNLHATRCR